MKISKEQIKKLLYTKINLYRTKTNGGWLCGHSGYVFRIKEHYSIDVVVKTKHTYQLITMNYDEDTQSYIYVDNDNNTTLSIQKIVREMNVNDHIIFDNIDSSVILNESARLQEHNMMEQYFTIYKSGKYIKAVCNYDSNHTPLEEVPYADSTLLFLARLNILEKDVHDFDSYNEMNVNFGSVMTMLKNTNKTKLNNLNIIQDLKFILKENNDTEMLVELIEMENIFVKSIVIDETFDYSTINDINDKLSDLSKLIIDKYVNI